MKLIYSSAQFYFAVLCCLPFWCFAQTIPRHCAFEPDPRQLEIMKGYQEAIERFGQLPSSELRAPIRVPVRLVVFSSRTASPSPTQADFDRALLTLNKTFQVANLEFFACESLRRVISSRYADFDSDLDEDNVWNSYGRSGIINIFCFEDIDFGSTLGYTYFPSQNGPEAIFLLQEELLTSTFPHEMGHYYGLYHTHGKSNCGTTDELVNDPNCARTGDDVCDTPADPNLDGLFCRGSLVDSATCKYIGKELDRSGKPFQPDPSNIMAYTWEHCTTRFTPGQYARMRFFAENVRLYAEDCSGRKICSIPQVVANQLSPGLMQFDWTAGGSSVFQARYRLGQDTTWIPLKAIYGNKWLAYDLGACTRVEFQVRAQCGDAYTNWSAPTLAFTKGCANNDGYCTSLGGSENVWINQLSLGEWVNKTGDDGGYDLFTPNDLSITAGKSYTLALQPGGFTRARDTLYWRVWVDFNRDKDFNDPGEQVFQAKSRGRSTIVKGSLAFPDSLAGSYRMRLSLSRGAYVDACGKGGIVLETEDYEWAIQKALSCPTPSKEMLTALDLRGKVQLNCNSVGTQYNWRYRRAYNTWDWDQVTKTDTNSYLVDKAFLIFGEPYKWQVQLRCENGALSDWSEVQDFMLSKCYFGDTLGIAYLKFRLNNLQNTADIHLIPNYFFQGFDVAIAWSYREKGSTQWIDTIYPKVLPYSDSLVIFPNVKMNTVYETMLEVYCKDDSLNVFRRIMDITVPATCFKLPKGGIKIEDLKPTSVIVIMDYYTYLVDVQFSRYEIRYRERGTLNYTLNSAPRYGQAFSNLKPNTTYELNVRMICPDGKIAEWSDDVVFTTPAAGLVEPELQLNPLGLVAESGTPQLRIIPNPSAGQFTLQVPNTLQGEGQVRVFNSTGQQVHQAKLNFSAGLPPQVRLSGQAPGVYFLRLQVGQTVFSERLILLHP